jgi:hypothetical protein
MDLFLSLAGFEAGLTLWRAECHLERRKAEGGKGAVQGQLGPPGGSWSVGVSENAKTSHFLEDDQLPQI